MLIDKIWKIVCIFTVLIMLSTFSFADEWIIYGGRESGMGGAGVANSSGAISQYWNPANLWHYEKYIADYKAPRILEPGSQAEKESKKMKKKLDSVNNAAHSDWDFSVNLATSPGVQGETISRLDAIYSIWRYLEDEGAWDILDEGLGQDPPDWAGIEPDHINAVFALYGSITGLTHSGTGVTFTTALGVNVRVENFAFSTTGYVYASLYPVIDFSHGNITEQDLDDFVGDLLSFGWVDPGDSVTTQGGQMLEDQLLSMQTELGIDSPETAALLAHYFEEASAYTGYNLEDPVVIQGIVNMLSQDNSAFEEDEAFANNDSAIRMKGVAVAEAAIGFGYGFEIQKFLEQVIVGVNAKVLLGRPVSTTYYFKDGEDGLDKVLDDLESSFDSNKNDTKFTFDLGVTCVFFDSRLRVSLVGKNITEPEFEYTSGNYYRVRGLYRLGAAFDVIKNMLTFAADLDVFPRTTSYMPNYKYQALSCGAEFKPVSNRMFGVAVRTGATANYANFRDEFMYTFGIGLRAWVLQLDFSMGLSPATRSYSNNSSPYYQDSFVDEFNETSPIPLAERISIAFSLSINSSW